MGKLSETSSDERYYVENLLRYARGDTGGSRRAAQFLLSLWNGDIFKADLQELLYVDPELFEKMHTLLGLLYKSNSQLSTWVSQEEMNPIIEIWGDAFRKK